MLFDRRIFFREIRLSVFRGRLSRAQADGMSRLLDVWEARYARHDARWLAYGLATDWHETMHRMQPVRETLAASERQAIARLRRWARKLPPKRRRTVLAYARVHPDTGHAYFGRGDVQLTWRRNYRKLSAVAGVDLEADPEKALEPEIAARILFGGLIDGLFTGFRLKTFIDGDKCDWRGARLCVNGHDRAEIVAGAAEAFHSALTAARIAARNGVDAPAGEREAMAYDTPEKAARGPAVNPLPAPPPEVIAGRGLPQTGKPAWRSSINLAALLAVLSQAATTRGGWLAVAGLAVGCLAVAWIVRERIRHAWEDGI